MSGIAGIINLDQKPVDKQLLSDLTETMAFRGPHGKKVWTQRYVGFSHTLLQTTIAAENDYQPCSLDGHTWIVADARVDNQSGLKAKLENRGVKCPAKSTDAELILQAYHTWGENLVNHLLGDFAFAIWDNQHQKLFCARDHFGIKPFLYARLPGCFIFSNTLECIRSHPLISNNLNEQVISEALLTGYNSYLDSSAFADIERLPPAHTLTITRQMPCVTRRYWDLSVQTTIRYKNRKTILTIFLSCWRHRLRIA